MANTGLRSIDASRGPAAAANADSRASMCASALMSAFGRPRAPSSSGAPLIERIICSATSSPNGQRRNTTSFITSTKMPPRPNIAIGPNTGSRWMPRMHSTPPCNCFATSTPSMRAVGAARLARASSSGVAVAHRGGIGDIQQHAADLRLVHDVGRQDLHHDREAEQFRRRDRLRRRCRTPASGADWMPAGASRRLASASLGVAPGSVDRRHVRRRRRAPGGERGAEAAHRGDRGHRARRVLVHHPAIGFQFGTPFRRRDHRQRVEPVGILRLHQVELLADRRPAARRCGHAEEAQHRRVAALADHRFGERVDQRHVVADLRGGIHRIARRAERHQRRAARFCVATGISGIARPTLSATSLISTPAPPETVITPSVLRAG